jgi:hypothetical protein
MAYIKLDNIAVRQRTYLVMDVLMAALAALILAIQVTVLSGANVPMAEIDERVTEPSLASPDHMPHRLAEQEARALATARTAALPDS